MNKFFSFSKLFLQYLFLAGILFQLVLIFGCDLFLLKRKIFFTLPQSSCYGERGPHPRMFEVEVISSSGDTSFFTGKPGESISIEIEEGYTQVILAYPVFENSQFKVKPYGIFYSGGITGEENLYFSMESGAPLIVLGELFHSGFSLPGFNSYRFSRLFNNRSDISPFAYDFVKIKGAIIQEKFSTLSLKKRETFSVEISEIPVGDYYPSDPFLQNVTVDSQGIFSTKLYVGLHQYLNVEDNILLELSCGENGSVIYYFSGNP